MTDTGLAYAKINISLDIISKMKSGYHNLKMVMQTISLSDEISIECLPGEGLSVESGLLYLPDDGSNTAAVAASAYFGHTGLSGYRTEIRIKKNIPVCAGLGGGSSDGACVLRMLDRMFGTNLGREKLEEIGLTVGSDVPFCIAGGTSLAEGRGEILKDLTPLPLCHIVICKPPMAFSTPELFKRVRCEKIRCRPDTDGLVAALETGDLKGIARRMYNVFEDVLPRGTSDIADIKYALLDKGALGAVMTGSGSAVFGIFDGEPCAVKAFEHLRAIYDECYLSGVIGKLL